MRLFVKAARSQSRSDLGLVAMAGHGKHIIHRAMTDKEIALEIGRKIVSLRHENAALKGTLNSLRITPHVPLDWKPQIEEILERQFHQSVREQNESLEQSIGTEDNAGSLLRKLHQCTFDWEP